MFILFPWSSQWAEVLSADAFSAFEDAGLDDGEVCSPPLVGFGFLPLLGQRTGGEGGRLSDSWDGAHRIGDFLWSVAGRQRDRPEVPGHRPRLRRGEAAARGQGSLTCALYSIYMLEITCI